MAEESQKITVRPSEPYLVRGAIPLVRKSQVMSEHGEPLSWKDEGVIDAGETYRLCRCGQSKSKPFCDGAHTLVEFDGTEAADTGTVADRATTRKSPKIFIQDEHSICVHSGFCGNRLTAVWKMRKESNDPKDLDEIRTMIENCPSGALAYSLEAEGEIIEPELPKQVVAIPDGPLWVTGGIPVKRSDGKPLETRNRVTLCRCGASAMKPLCDGTHKELGFTDS